MSNNGRKDSRVNAGTESPPGLLFKVFSPVRWLSQWAQHLLSVGTVNSEDSDHHPITLGEDVRSLVQRALQSDLERPDLLALRDEDSAEAFRIIEELLQSDSRLSNDPQAQQKHISLLVALSEASKSYPPDLFLQAEIADKENASRFGHFAYVYFGRYKDSEVAVKMIRVSMREFRHIECRKRLYREAITWRHLRHPFVLPLVGIDNTAFTGYDCLISPWVEHGSVATCTDWLQKNGREVPYARWINETLQGVEYLHSRQIVHGELRGSNVMVDTSLTVRLTDFGLSFIYLEAETDNTLAGRAVQWMAPELILCETPIFPSYPSDIYSFACVCVEIYSHQPPFFDLAPVQVILRISKGLQPARPQGTQGAPMSDDLWQLIQSCWLPTPSDRPRAADLLAPLKKASY